MEKEENKLTIISQPISMVDPILVHILCILPAFFFFNACKYIFFSEKQIT